MHTRTTHTHSQAHRLTRTSRASLHLFGRAHTSLWPPTPRARIAGLPSALSLPSNRVRGGGEEGSLKSLGRSARRRLSPSQTNSLLVCVRGLLLVYVTHGIRLIHSESTPGAWARVLPPKVAYERFGSQKYFVCTRHPPPSHSRVGSWPTEASPDYYCPQYPLSRRIKPKKRRFPSSRPLVHAGCWCRGWTRWVCSADKQFDCRAKENDRRRS